MKFEGLDFNYVEFDPHEVMKGFTSKWKNTGILQGIVTARTGPMGIKVSTSEGSWALKKDQLAKTGMLSDASYIHMKSLLTTQESFKHQKVKKTFDTPTPKNTPEQSSCPVMVGDNIHFKASTYIFSGVVQDIHFNDAAIKAWIIDVNPNYSPNLKKSGLYPRSNGNVRTVLSNITQINGYDFYEPNNAAGWGNGKSIGHNEEKPPLLYHRKPTMRRK